MKRILFLPLFVLAVTGLFSACGEEEQTTYSCVDYDGKVYKTVIIGDQVWMAENLATYRYNTGGSITNSQDAISNPNQKFPMFSFYGDNPDNFNTYGLIYNYFAAKRVVLIPNGWRLPTKAEWEKLVDYVNAHPAYGTNSWEAKALASSVWKGSTVTGAIGFDRTTNNKFGFNALPGGFKTEYGTFAYETEQCHFWTSTVDPSTNLLQFAAFEYDKTDIRYETLDSLKSGAYIRCVRDL